MTSRIYRNEDKQLVFHGDGFKIVMHRYSDPERLNLARNAAIYLGKKDRHNTRRPLTIIKQGHVPEIFRGEFVEFEFIDVSKEVYDHLITYTTRNMRATGGNRALASEDFAMPGDKMKDESLVQEAIVQSMDSYKALLDAGETKQVARSAMPVSAKMNPFVYQFNFLTLGESLFRQRIWEKGAQGNTVKVVQGMYELCRMVDCELWETFYEHKGTPILEWQEVRKSLKKKKVTVAQFAEEILVDDKELTVIEVVREILEGREGGEGVTVVELIEELAKRQNGDKVLVDYLTERSGQLKSMW